MYLAFSTDKLMEYIIITKKILHVCMIKIYSINICALEKIVPITHPKTYTVCADKFTHIKKH